MPTLRRGYCGDCQSVTDWMHGLVRSRFTNVLVARCEGCGNELAQG